MSVCYFPFCPGIPWQLNSSRVVQPTLNSEIWSKAVNDKNPIITCFGGLFETFFALSYAEALNKLIPTKKLIFNGNSTFNKLISLNGLATSGNLISKSEIEQYPLPLFFDQENNVYFNCLFNYLKIYNNINVYAYKNLKALSKQIFINSCLPWNINYIPKLRNLIEPPEFAKWKLSKKFNIDKPFVLIFPDKTGLSEHPQSALKWSINDIKSFISMTYGSGMESVIVTKNIGRYTGINSLVIEPNLEHIFYLIEKCGVILAEEIDFLLISLMISKNATVVSRKNKYQYSIKSNKKFYKTDIKIIESKKLIPFEVYKAIK